jgi:hypothetical protein
MVLFAKMLSLTFAEMVGVETAFEVISNSAQSQGCKAMDAKADSRHAKSTICFGGKKEEI